MCIGPWEGNLEGQYNRAKAAHGLSSLGQIALVFCWFAAHYRKRLSEGREGPVDPAVISGRIEEMWSDEPKPGAIMIWLYGHLAPWLARCVEYMEEALEADSDLHGGAGR